MMCFESGTGIQSTQCARKKSRASPRNAASIVKQRYGAVLRSGPAGRRRMVLLVRVNAFHQTKAA
ncbi:hypothetical protein T190_27235 [Sinorhizobium meliloti CCBAU 01290]|nr:hypothetical protein T190_27235 [Sinorhizobium meliloti CCBAU 01290]